VPILTKLLRCASFVRPQRLKAFCVTDILISGSCDVTACRQKLRVWR
jgi:hypothetical protein